MTMLERALAFVAAIMVVGFVVLGFDAYGDADLGACIFDGHGRRARVVRSYLCSPYLLAGSPRDWFAFAWLWSFPVAVAGFSFAAWRRARRANSLSIIRSE